MKERISSRRWLLLTLALTISVCALGQAQRNVSTNNANNNSQGGRCTPAGSWKQTAEDIGTSIWKIDNTGRATESGLGGATGTATLTGNRLRIDWKISADLYGYYEWLLDSDCNSGQGELVFQKGYNGTTHKSTVTRQEVNSADGRQPTLPVPSPTPIPPVDSGSSKGMAKFVNEPDHSPDKLDFGEVWNGQFSSRIFRLTANASGYVRAEIPTGPFRVAEIRTLGPLKSGKDTSPQLKGTPQDTKGRVTFQEGMPGPWTAHADPGDEVQVYVVFKPKFDLFQMTAGEKSATMKVAGPGPKSEWNLTVPLRGMFNGLIVGAAFTVDDRDVMAVQGTQRIDVAVRLTGTDSVLQGAIRGKNLPPGIQINPLPVTVNPSQTTTLKVAVFPNWGMLQPDAQPRNIELVFEAGQKSSSATFSLTPLPGTVSLGDANRKDCGIESLGWLAQFYPTGRVVLSLSGSNFDLVNNRNVIGIVNVAGRPVAYGILHFKIGSGTPDYKQWDSSHLNVDFDSRFRADDYISAVHGPVTLTCHLVDSNSKPPF